MIAPSLRLYCFIGSPSKIEVFPMEKRFPRRYSPSSTPSADTLDPPWFPGWTLLVQDYDAGIPARLVEGGLLCIVEPWTNMEVGDDFKLYWSDGSAPVWSTVVDQNQKNQRLAFRIDEGHIVEGDAFPVFYSVLRSSSTQPVVSQPQWNLLVKLDPPGGFDPDQGTPGHSGLKYSIPQDILDNGVGPDEAAAGVPITIKPYKNMRRRDEINVAWGTENVYHTVAEDEENQEITITIPLEVIERAEDSDALAVAYQVVDECGNYPGGYWRWSAVTHVLVDVNNNRLDPPLVLVDGFPVEEVDLAELAGNPVTVRVTANRYEHAVGDLLRLTWRGTAADSSPVIVGPLEHTVQTIPYYYDFTIPHDDVAAIARGRASVSYVRIRSGEKDLPSKSTSVTVIGDARQYLAPEIVEAVGGTLDPDLSFYTLSVPYYPGRTAGDEIIIICDGRTSTTLPTYHEVTAIVGGEPVGAPVLANLAKEQVKRLDGGSLTVYYSVNGQPESEHLVLSVGVAAPSLPIPTVVEAPNDVLNPDDVNPLIGVNVHATHTATIPEDVVVLRWRGSSSNAPDQSRTLTGNTAGKLVPFTVPFRYVTENLNGTVDVSYSITRGTSLLGNSIVRHLTVGSVLDLKAPSVEEANGAILNPVNAKDKLTVVVPANAALLPEDKLKVTWTGAPGTPAGGSYTSEEWPVRDGWDVPMTNSVVAFNLGKAVTVTYTVIQNGVESPPSDPFTLNVQAMPVASLTMPLIPEAAQGGIGSVLDLSSFSGDARVTVAPWPLIAIGQRVWLKCEGTAAGNGADYTIPLYSSSAVIESELSAGLSKAIPRTELEKLRIGSELKVILQVTFDRTSTQANAVDFPLRTYRVTAEPLIVDPTPMRLDGIKFFQSYGLAQREVPNNTGTRTPTGGVPPYSYTSLNPQTASVSDVGKVAGLRNGVTTVVIKDSAGAEVHYEVVVENIVRLLRREGPTTAADVHAWARQIGWNLPKAADTYIMALAQNFETFEGLLETLHTPDPGGRYTGLAYIWNDNLGRPSIAAFVWRSTTYGALTFHDDNTQLFPRMLAFEPINS
ncbi:MULTISPECIES: hypothetical protein [Pseudomonas]|uniref:hypothetical protein n=1 Tax=Pseudomonas TaxID=286 RepID=UPI0011CD5D8F|nr:MULTISPECIES: hypothetical protein [Pseudomonas]MDT8905910.1 hypothetical protein [Pseudomonas prosekii]